MGIKIFVIILILISISIMSGCVGNEKQVVSSELSLLQQTRDMSKPQTQEEIHCLNVLSNNVGDIQFFPGGKAYSPIIQISGQIQSNCQYPVNGVAYLWMYDRSGNLIKGTMYSSGIQSLQPIYVTPGQTISYSIPFDIRSIPYNPRNPLTINDVGFEVTADVTQIA